MTAGRTAAGGDAAGIDIPFFGMFTNIAHGGAGVSYTVVGGDAFSASDAVFGAEGNQAELGEVLGLTIEMGRGAAVPAAAEEEEDGGARFGLIGGGGQEGVEMEIDLGCLFIEVDLIRFERALCKEQGGE